MFRTILKIWAEQSFSKQVVDEFLSMLNSSEEMLSYAFKKLTAESTAPKAEKKVYLKDQGINLKERDIRRRVLVHLSANPGCNVSACLILVSVSKDAERLGDYIKNLFELRDLMEGHSGDYVLFEKLFQENGNSLLKLFKDVETAFKDSNKDIATAAVQDGYDIAKQCESIINEAAVSEHLPRQAVIISLGALYIKRIALHLTNIVSSVVNPVTDLDFTLSEVKEQTD